MKRIDLTGQRFGRLVATGNNETRNGIIYWECKCDCGNTTYVASQSLRVGDSKSCGCLQRELAAERHRTHGAYENHIKRERLYNIYSNMKARCLNPNEPAYVYYGARGITVCQTWCDSYEAFRDWALANGYSDTLTIDRVNNDGNYEPDNCRWATMYEQVHNKRQGKLPERDVKTGRFLPKEAHA